MDVDDQCATTSENRCIDGYFRINKVWKWYCGEDVNPTDPLVGKKCNKFALAFNTLVEDCRPYSDHCNQGHCNYGEFCEKSGFGDIGCGLPDGSEGICKPIDASDQAGPVQCVGFLEPEESSSEGYF